MSFQVTHTSFPITFESIEDFFELEKQKLRNVYVKAPTKAKRERNLNWQVYGCDQLENCTLIGVLFILPLWLGNSEAIGKKTVDRVIRIECKQVTDGMN